MKTQANPTKVWKSSNNSLRGFTLVEVLVVITIIAVLAALAFVTTGSIRSKAQQANAMASLRQVAAVNVAYAAENNGDINTLRWVGDPKEGGGGAWVRNSFWGRIQPYLFEGAAVPNQAVMKKDLDQRLDQMFISPDANTMANTAISGARIYHDGSGLPVPIAFNANLHKWGNFVKVSTINDPSRTLYSTYGFGFFTQADGQAYAPMPQDRSTPTNKIYYLSNQKALAAFLDGHVEMVSPPMPSYNFN